MTGVEGAGGIDAAGMFGVEVGFTETGFVTFLFGTGGFFEVGYVKGMGVDGRGGSGVVVRVRGWFGFISGPFNGVDVYNVGGEGYGSFNNGFGLGIGPVE